MKILVISHNKDFIQGIRMLFSDEPYEILGAFKGEEGLIMAGEHQPDLVLMDVVMPGLDGYEVCRQIKSDPGQHGIFVVLISGMKTATDHLSDGFESGADGYLTKPIPDRELHARINAYARIIRSEKALRKSEEMFRHIFENSPVGKSITGIDGSLRVNRAFCEMLGYSREELLHKNWKEITHPDDIEKSDEAVGLLLGNKIGKAVFEKRYIHKNGQEVWAEVSTTTQKDENRKPQFFITCISNITPRKKAEHQFQTLSARNEAILSSVPDIVMEVDNKKVYTWANQAGLEFFGKDVIGKEASFFFEGEQSTYEKVAPVFYGSEQIIYVESWQRRKDGEKRLLAWWCRTLKDHENKVTGALSAARDITEQKLAIDEIRHNEAQLKSLISILQHESATIQEFLDFSLNEAITLTGSKIGYIYFYDEKEEQFILNSWSKEVMKECSIPDPPTCFELANTGIWGEAVRQRKPIIINDFQAFHPLKCGYPEGHAPLIKYMTIPVFHEGKINAVVGVANKANDYTETDMLQLTLLMDNVWRVVLQKRSEIAIREGEENFRAIFENNSAAVAIIETDTRISMVNEAYCRLSGYSSSEVIGMSWTEQIHPDDLERLKDYNKKRLLDPDSAPDKYEFRFFRKDGSVRNALMSVSMIMKSQKIITSFIDITEQKQAENNLRRIEWMLGTEKENASPASEKEIIEPAYGDLIKLNSNRLILNSVGSNLLYDIADDYLSLLGTSSAVYEKNGDYALGIFSSGWCRFMDQASRNLCDTDDNREALSCGKWLCHESCWTRASKTAIEEGKPTDIECEGGIHLYAVPILADREIVGAINFGYGDPPHEPSVLIKLSEKFGVPVETLQELSNKYESRPPFIISLAKKRLEVSARLIGEIVERKRAEEALNISVSQWQSTFDAVNDGICLIDLDQHILRCNSAMADMFHLSESQMIGKHCFQIVHGTYTPLCECPVLKMKATGKRENLEVHITGQWYDIIVDPLFDDHGQLVGAVHIVRNITEKVETLKLLEEMNITLEKRVAERTSALQTSNDELEAFAYSVSHDLRAPLRALNGFSHILQEEHTDKLDEEGLRLLKVISENAKKMGHLIDDLLAFSRLNRQEIKSARINMKLMANEVFEEFKLEAGNNTEFHILSIPDADGDPSMIRQVWRNLIGNAIKFSAPKPHRIIEIGNYDEGDQSVYYIRDNGVGFDMEYAPKMFGVFQRLHSAAEFDGTGVGLAIVQRIVHRHGGRVWAEGKVDEGAVIYYTLATQNKE